jgi:hypothetical protein
MFKSNTVFVVGAGASCELGLPSGQDLKRIIASALDIRFDFGRLAHGDARIVHALQEHVGGQLSDINPYLAKARRIRDAMPASISIDNYLDAHQGDAELELCGKLAIVKSILDAEGTSKLRSLEHHVDAPDVNAVSDSWLLRFMRTLTEGVRKPDSLKIFDNVSIVCFNYDRCIQRYLMPALAAYYDLSKEDAISIVKTLRIYHPYGHVGLLPWQSAGDGVRFGSGDRADLLQIARGIKTFTEGQDDEGVMGPIIEVLSQAETLVFLGFAFHQQNLDLITPDETIIRRTYGTTHGISANNTMTIMDALQNMLGYKWVDPSIAEHRHNIHLHESTCAGLFDEFSRSLSSAAR